MNMIRLFIVYLVTYSPTILVPYKTVLYTDMYYTDLYRLRIVMSWS